jgi:hypothetical protein
MTFAGISLARNKDSHAVSTKQMTWLPVKRYGIKFQNCFGESHDYPRG